MNKKNIIITGIAFLLLTFLMLFVINIILTERPEPVAEDEATEDPLEEITEEERYIVSLPRGLVVAAEDSHFIIERGDVEKTIQVNVTEETEFVNINEKQPVSIPEENRDWLSQFYYIKDHPDEEFVIHVYFDTEEDLGEVKEFGVFEFNEVTATYVAWSFYSKF